jgi:hypothetical protein
MKPIINYIGIQKFASFLSEGFTLKSFCNKLDKAADSLSHSSNNDELSLLGNFSKYATRSDKKNYIIGLGFEAFIELMYLSSVSLNIEFIQDLKELTFCNPLEDKGVDAFGKNCNGSLSTIQIKFRGGRHRYVFTKDDDILNFVSYSVTKFGVRPSPPTMPLAVWDKVLYLITNCRVPSLSKHIQEVTNGSICVISGMTIDNFLDFNSELCSLMPQMILCW